MRVVVKLGSYTWRPLSDSDADARFVIATRNDPRFRPMFYHDSAITHESHQRFIRAAEQRDEINWLIESAPSATPMGLASIYNIDPVERKCECGRVVMLDPRLFYRSWLVSAFTLFEILGLQIADIETLEHNRVIAHGVERMGMKFHRLLTGHVVRAGRPLNARVFRITADEYCTALKAGRYARWGRPELVSFEGRTFAGA